MVSKGHPKSPKHHGKSPKHGKDHGKHAKGKHGKGKIPTKLVRKVKDFLRHSKAVADIKTMLKGGESICSVPFVV